MSAPYTMNEQLSFTRTVMFLRIRKTWYYKLYICLILHVLRELNRVYSRPVVRVLTRLLQANGGEPDFSPTLGAWLAINSIYLKKYIFFLLKISFLTFPDWRIFLTYLLLFWRMSGWVDITNFFFVSRSFDAFPDFLTCLLLFRRMSGWVDLKNCFFCISFSWFQIRVLTLTWLPEGVTHSSIS